MKGRRANVWGRVEGVLWEHWVVPKGVQRLHCPLLLMPSLQKARFEGRHGRMNATQKRQRNERKREKTAQKKRKGQAVWKNDTLLRKCY